MNHIIKSRFAGSSEWHITEPSCEQVNPYYAVVITEAGAEPLPIAVQNLDQAAIKWLQSWIEHNTEEAALFCGVSKDTESFI